MNYTNKKDLQDNFHNWGPTIVRNKVLYKIKHLCTTIINYATANYNIDNWPTSLEYDLSLVEGIEKGIIKYDENITKHEMVTCNEIYKRYNTLTKGG